MDGWTDRHTAYINMNICYRVVALVKSLYKTSLKMHNSIILLLSFYREKLRRTKYMQNHFYTFGVSFCL